jgi:hypothetical protein
MMAMRQARTSWLRLEAVNPLAAMSVIAGVGKVNPA